MFRLLPRERSERRVGRAGVGAFGLATSPTPALPTLRFAGGKGAA